MTDISSIFKAYDIRGLVGTELNAELVENIGRAFADWLPKEGPIAVGYDMRPSSPLFAEALIKGLTAQGRDCWNIGMVSSDMVYFAPGKFPELAGGVMITASHNPAEYNGIKFCREEALPVGLESGLAEIRDKALAADFKPEAEKPGSETKKDIMDVWIEHVLSFIDTKKVKPFRVGIDAANGMVGYTWQFLTKHLPIEVFPLYFEPDGTFPNHEANPMKVETLKDLSELIVREKLDFGLAFDGDGDRFALVDEKGQPVSGSMTFALLVEYVMKHNPGTKIVHEVRTSHSTINLIKELGGTPVRSKAGNTIIKEVTRQHDAAFGGETTGHFMFRDNYFVDSAMVAAAVSIEVLSEADFTLSEFVAKHDTAQSVPEFNITVTDKDATIEAVLAAFQDVPGIETSRLDGLTIDFPDDSWFNIRPSNTEPLMRINAEAKTQADLQHLIDTITTAVSKP